MHPTNPFCAGMQGVIQAYQHAIRTVSLWGPTNFAPVINHVAKWVHSDQDLYELSLKGVIWYWSVLLLVTSHVGDTGLQLLVCNNCCDLAASMGQRLIPGFMPLQTWNSTTSDNISMPFLA